MVEALISYTLGQSSGGSSQWEDSLGTDGGHNLDGEPRFVNPIVPSDAPTTTGDYRLRSGSAAIDAGDNAAAAGDVILYLLEAEANCEEVTPGDVIGRFALNLGIEYFGI